MNTPRPGGYVWYRKPGQPARTRGLIEHIQPDGNIRVRPDTGRRTLITPRDIERAQKGDSHAREA